MTSTGNWLSYISLPQVTSCLPIPCAAELARTCKDARAIVRGVPFMDVTTRVCDTRAWRELFPNARGVRVRHNTPITKLCMYEHVRPDGTLFVDRECPESCVCGGRYAEYLRLASLHTLDFTENWTITSMTLPLLSGVKVLTLRNCIRLMCHVPFASLVGLEELDISDCASLDNSSLHGLTNLRVLRVNGDVRFSDAAFKDLSNLRVLEARAEGGSALNMTDAAFQYMPALEEVTINWSMEGLRGSFVQHLPRLRVLRGMHGTLFPVPLGLRVLELSMSKMTDEELSGLVDLEDLTLVSCDYITGTAFQHLRQLKRLSVEHCPLIMDAVFPYLGRVHTLRVRKCGPITPSMFSHLTSIKTLDMDGLTDAAFPYLRNVKELCMRACFRVTDAAFQYLTNVCVLNMSECRGVTDTAFRHLTNVRELDMSWCERVTDAAFIHLQNIQKLRLAGQHVTDAMFPYLRGLHTLDLFSCENVTDAAIQFIANIKFLSVRCARPFWKHVHTHLKNVECFVNDNDPHCHVTRSDEMNRRKRFGVML